MNWFNRFKPKVKPDIRPPAQAVLNALKNPDDWTLDTYTIKFTRTKAQFWISNDRFFPYEPTKMESFFNDDETKALRAAYQEMAGAKLICSMLGV